MMVLPTVLLRHQAHGLSPAVPAGTHYDWLMGDPADPGGRLWAARTEAPSDAWERLRQWDLHELPPHRRIYLDFEGPLSGGRGIVARVDQGTATPVLWSGSRRVLDLRLDRCRGRVVLVRLGPDLWRAQLGAEDPRDQTLTPGPG
jgi:hypothetical protein